MFLSFQVGCDSSYVSRKREGLKPEYDQPKQAQEEPAKDEVKDN